MRPVLTLTALLLTLLLAACPAKQPRTVAPGNTAPASPAALGADNPPDPRQDQRPEFDPGKPQPPEAPEGEGIVHLDQGADGSTITLKQGQRLELSLPSNPGTGYTWNLARLHDGQPYSLNQAVLELLGSRFVQSAQGVPAPPDEPTPPEPPVPPLPEQPRPGDPPDQPPYPGQPPGGPPEDARPGDPLPGAGGMELWTLEAASAGSAELCLEYRRTWEKDLPAAATFALTVVVEPEQPSQPQPPSSRGG